jgi:alkylated DNA repair protein (DNA oxidative demethylase)
MPRSGKPFSVRMTNCGDAGLGGRQGRLPLPRQHPVTGAPWPPIPERLLKLWDDLTGYPRPPQACLVNFYDTGARMGLHQDRDESDFSAPVLSISLGDACLFRIGGTERRQPTRSFRLESGDVVILGGESRLAFHGVDRIYPTTSTLLRDGGRINLTLRRVTGS